MKQTVVSLLLLVLTIVIVSIEGTKFSEVEYRNTFTQWMITYQKEYSANDFLKRYQIFKNNMDFVDEWNSKGSETILGLNLFADLSNDEFVNTYMMPKYDVEQMQRDTVLEGIFGHSHISNNFVSDGVEVDWRTKGAVSEVKNQGACGSCWSFSTTGSIESAHFMATGNMVTLSEQNLMDCTFNVTGNQGCGGGAVAPAYKYVIENGGIDTEASYPYTAENGKDGCQFNPDNVGATIDNFNFVLPFFSEKALEYMVTQRPISVSIDAAQPSFQLYSGGIYFEPKCSTTFLTHDVLAVGYGSGIPSNDTTSTGSASEDSWSGTVTSSATATTASGSGTSSSSQSSAYQTSGSQSGGWSASVTSSDGATTSTPVPSTSGSSSSGSGSNNYWIVKNSWTRQWGIDGYIYMSKDRNNNCGIASYAKWPIINN
ncbi:cysteine proteinase [Tieghemostelium lacteum]|uniref:Cysteine proteinase n=1 Tax=Tieghemostelium lacteum TaxID=361077 RepID=A0A152A9R5_TIELA|nr:cysteine proteinase [Tieghemostelium lacteum]|eukprot:KYR02954.1 cysteine proteinase [Tieghemostelium lacteum]